MLKDKNGITPLIQGTVAALGTNIKLGICFSKLYY